VKPECLSRDEARRIALHAQGFGTPRAAATSDAAGIRRSVERMGLLQIDSVNVLVRAHYLPIFSRHGGYDSAMLDTHAFDPARRTLFEYWAHEASLLPVETYPLLRWRMERAERLDGVSREGRKFARARRRLIDDVLAELTARGPLSAREIGGERRPKKEGGWWNRHDGKVALEHLFHTGRVGAATRRGFERVYDLVERVMPPAILARPVPDEAEAQRRLLRISSRAFGVATEADLRDYFRLPAADATLRVREMVEAGDLLPVRVEGWRHPAHLDPQAEPARPSDSAALVSPFDPLIWYRDRTERLFDFHYRIEIYTPAPKRRFGYYVLPFLLGERLVARVDLKADRARKTLRVPAAHGEAGIDPARATGPLARELRMLASWLGLSRVVVGRRGDLSKPLRDSLKSAER
jgi:uncharacterized protein YcaQ